MVAGDCPVRVNNENVTPLTNNRTTSTTMTASMAPTNTKQPHAVHMHRTAANFAHWSWLNAVIVAVRNYKYTLSWWSVSLIAPATER